MLTDIFAERYAAVPLWDSFEEKDRRFLVQAFRIISEQLYPYWTMDGREDPKAIAKWKIIHDKLSMELGFEALSATTYNEAFQVKLYPLITVCGNYVCVAYDEHLPADLFMKNRISFIEIAFRERADELDAATEELEEKLEVLRSRPQRSRPQRGIRLPGDPADGLKAVHERLLKSFQDAIDELNTRMRRAGYDLNYHNGFIQRFSDPIAEEQIERPFWSLVSNAIWKNVDVDMKEAIDRRDNDDRDPAFYAARALESTLKIISNNKGWSHGGETGAHNFIDNLGSRKAGQFITVWEKAALKDFFTHVRNPLSHGPGDENMPELNPQQTDWAIEVCMSWTKTLIRRM